MYVGSKIKKLLFVALAVVALPLSGCAGHEPDTQVDTEQKDFSDVMYMDFAEFKKLHKKQTASICSYYMDMSTIPESRTVECGYRSFDNFDEGKLVELTSDGISISNDKIMFSAWNHFKTKDSMEITGLNSIDEIWANYNQPLWYIEEKGLSVLVFEIFEPERSYYTVFYGKNGDYKMVEIDKDKKYSIPYRPQVTDEKIYLFTEALHNESSFLVTAIDIGSREAELSVVKPEDMGLPDKKLMVHPHNIFIDGNVLFVYANYHKTGYVALYDFKSGKGTNIDIKNDFGFGKLFRYGDGLGLTVSQCINSEYDTSMGIRFFGFETDNLSVWENEEAYVEIAREAEYFYSIFGHYIYCVGDKLCGLMKDIDIDTGMTQTDVYVEISLPDGAVTTFIPLEIKEHDCYSYTILENGVAVSPHNVN